MANAMDSQSKWAKPEDWDQYRNTITALFTCHSLPNVIRIMREEHNFHATPKMFQVQIYRKWGLRKGRPGNKNPKKRRRLLLEDDDEDDDEDEDDNDDDEDDYEDDVRRRRRLKAQKAKSNASAGDSDFTSRTSSFTLTHRHEPDPRQSLLESQNTQITAMPRAHLQQIAADLGAAAPPPAENYPAVVIPVAYQEFLNMPMHQPAFQFQGQQAAVADTTTSSETYADNHHEDDGHYTYAGSPDSSKTPGSREWMSTVMMQTMATSDSSTHSHLMPPSNARAPPSSFANSYGTHSSSSRTSHASSSRTTLMSSISSGSRSRTKSVKSSTSTMTLPRATLRNIKSPDGLLLPEKSMFFARHYISSTFSTGLWTLSQSTDTTLLDTECVKLDRWYNDFNPGLELLRGGGVDSAFRIFQRCFAGTKDIIEPQDPRVGIYIIQQAIRFMFFDTWGRNLSRSLLRFTTGLCRELFSAQHPLCIILNQLALMDNFEFAQNVPAFMNCYFDHLEPFLDQSSDAFGFINELRGLTISLMEATGMMGLYEAKPELARLIQRAKAYGHVSLHLKVETAAMLQRNRFFVEARQILEELRASEEARKHPYEFVYAGIILMVTLRRMKEGEEAIRVGYEMAAYLERGPDRSKIGSEFNEELFKSQRHSSLVLVFGKLEKDLRDAGRVEEAKQVHERLENAITQQYGSETLTSEPQADGNDLAAEPPVEVDSH